MRELILIVNRFEGFFTIPAGKIAVPLRFCPVLYKNQPRLLLLFELLPEKNTISKFLDEAEDGAT